MVKNTSLETVSALLFVENGIKFGRTENPRPQEYINYIIHILFPNTK